MKNKFVFCLIIIFGSLMGCAKVIDLSPINVLKQNLNIHVGEELTLLTDPIKEYAGTSLIDMEGNVHVFAIDSQNLLNHIEVSTDNCVARETLGVINTKNRTFLDAIEHPVGTIRILANDKQYIRSNNTFVWQMIEENHCTKFITSANDLFCAFVTKGGEIRVPKRKDYTAGLFFILPIFWWRNVDAAKIVLAQETKNGWGIRAVLDQDTDQDANYGFLLDSDNYGKIHILYYASKGGSWFIVGGGPGGAGGFGGGTSVPELRYAQVSINDLLNQNISKFQNQGFNQKIISEDYIKIKSTFLELEKYFTQRGIYKTPNIQLNIDEFRVDKLNGILDGLLNMTVLNFLNNYEVILELTIEEGKWPPNYRIFRASEFIPYNHDWNQVQIKNFKKDNHGNTHILFKGEKNGFFKTHYFISYSVRKNEVWSSPILLGSATYWQVPLLTLDQNGNVFVSWIEKDGKLVGRWIRSDIENAQ